MNRSERQARADELFLRPPLWKIFVSSEMRSGTLNRERRVAAAAIENTGLARAWYWERDAVAGPYSSESVCIGEAKTSEMLVLIVAETVTDIVRKEFDAARNSGSACFVFTKATVTMEPETKQFIDQIRARGHVTIKFDDADQLSERIDEAIRRYAIQSVRIRSFETRASRSTTSQFGSTVWPTTSVASPTPAYQQFSDGFGPSEEDDAGPLGEVNKQVNVLLAEGHYKGALEILASMSQVAQELGFAQDALQLLALVKKKVPPEAIDRADLAWLLNTEGLALLASGYRAEAMARFDTMRDIGAEIGDRLMVSVALQNMALLALQSGDHAKSEELAQLSLSEKLAINDFYGFTQLINNLATLAQDRGDLDEAASLLAMNEPIVLHLKDQRLLTTYNGNLGNLAVRRGDFLEADRLFRIALKHSRQAANFAAQITCLLNLGAVQCDQGQYSKSIQWYRKALQLAIRTESRPAQQVLHSSLGVVFHRLGRHVDAAEQFDSARRLAVELGDRLGWAALSADLGAVMISLGQADEAAPLIEQAIDVFQEERDDTWLARAYLNLLEAQAALDNDDAATTAAEMALRFLPLSAHRDRARVLIRAAEVNLIDNRNRQRAADLLQRALIEHREDSSAEEMAWHAAQAGAQLYTHGALSFAVSFFSQALEILGAVDDPEMRYQIRNDRANALTALERFDEARRDYEACLLIATNANNRPLEFQSRMNMGEMERRSGNLELAIAALSQAVNLARDLGDRLAEAEALGNLGLSLAFEGKGEEARKNLQAARKLARQIRHKHAEAMAVGGLATDALMRERFEEAAKFYRRAITLEEELSDHIHLIESLAGLIQSLAALGDVQGVSKNGQRLVDLAQKTGQEPIAVRAFSSVGQAYLSLGLVDEAAGVFEGAIMGAIVAKEEDPELLAWPFVAIALSKNELPYELRDSFSLWILGSLEKRYSLPEETMDVLRQVVQIAKETV